MIEAGWSRGDRIAAWSLGVASLAGAGGVWAALFNTQFQEWWKERMETAKPITLGSLSNAASYQVPLAPGVLTADRKTLQVLLDAFSAIDMYWLRTNDFGGSFRWSHIENMQKYVWYNDRPEHEFLDKELERMRADLKSKIEKFSHLAGLYTTAIFHVEDDEVRKIPDQYDNGKYSDERFFKKSGEINHAAEAVHDAYNNVIRRARLKLALSEPKEGGE